MENFNPLHLVTHQNHQLKILREIETITIKESQRFSENLKLVLIPLMILSDQNIKIIEDLNPMNKQSNGHI